MQFAIYDASMPLSKQKNKDLAASYLSWELKRRCLPETSIESADIILATCPSVSSFDGLQRVKKKFPGKIIIAGGAGSTSPYSLGLVASAVCVGDGQFFIKTIAESGIDAALEMNNVWINNDNRPVEIDHHFPWAAPPIMGADGYYRAWCGRGCKNKCLFCQTGWACEYQENPNPGKLLKQIRAIKSKKISYLSNDLSQHSFFSKLPNVDNGSYSIRFLKKYGLPHGSHIRLGVEGVSERLRAFVNKPIKNKDLLGCTKWLNMNGKSVRWFMIAGLPSETIEDWEELKDVIQRWKFANEKGTLTISFTAWCPDPATPLAIMPLDDFYYVWFEDFKEWFFGGKGWSNKIQLLKPQKPESRMKKAMLSMGLTENQLRSGGLWGPNDRVVYPKKAAAKKIGETVLKKVTR